MANVYLFSFVSSTLRDECQFSILLCSLMLAWKLRWFLYRNYWPTTIASLLEVLIWLNLNLRSSGFYMERLQMANIYQMVSLTVSPGLSVSFIKDSLSLKVFYCGWFVYISDIRLHLVISIILTYIKMTIGCKKMSCLLLLAY